MSKRFTPPTPDELDLQAAKIGLPQREAEKFFCYYASKGWMVGKNPMRNWRIAMSGWKLRWEEQRGPNGNVACIIQQEELKRVMGAMASLRNSYSEHQSWDELDCQKWTKLKQRRDELRKLLGVMV